MLSPFPRTEVCGMTASTHEDFSILITDDDNDCRETLRDIIEPQGFRTLLASSGEEALEIVQEKAIHLALLDMHLPHMTGLETLRLLHQVRSLLPCILVTGDTSDSLIRQACQAQAYSVIHKPVSRGVVLYTVTRALFRFYRELRDDPPGEGSPRKP
jgi:two-component system chemotaxis response regulator CheY